MSQKEITLISPARQVLKSRTAVCVMRIAYCALRFTHDARRTTQYAQRPGFTLLEILIAVAIIALIVSMVYGSYFATAESAEAYDTAIELSGQARQALAQMARQIRCAYIPPLQIRNSRFEIRDLSRAKSRDSGSEARQSMAENAPDDVGWALAHQFSGAVNGPSGEVLRLVTTDGSCAGPQLSNGLFEVIYTFDKSRGLLSFSQQRFIERLDGGIAPTKAEAVLTGVERFELRFYDGQSWVNTWDFKDKCRPPLAVKIDITCQDKNYRRCRYATVAYVPSHKNQGKKTAADTVISVDKQ